MNDRSDSYTAVLKLAAATAVLAICFVGITAFIYFLNFSGQPLSGNPELWGVFGDFFGGTLGPALNLITVILLVSSLIFQRLQLQDAKEDEAKARSHAEEQHQVAMKQSFEQTFFSWLNSHRAIVASISISRRRPAPGVGAGIPDTYTGTVAMKAIWDESMDAGNFRNHGAAAGIASLEKITDEVNKFQTSDDYDVPLLSATMIATYEAMYASFMPSLDTMYRTLHQMVKWIDGSDRTMQEKFFYMGIVRAHLSSVEMWFLMMHSLSNRGGDLLALINRYALLADMETHTILRPIRAAPAKGLPMFRDTAFSVAQAMRSLSEN